MQRADFGTAPLATMGWEDGTSLMDWCEENYVHSDQIAEFFNTITNLAYCFVGLTTFFGLAQHSAFSRLRVCGISLVLVGLGSMGFHGTLTRLGQAADELSIIYWEIAMLFCVFERRLQCNPWANKYIWALMILETWLYFQMDSHPQLGWALYHPLHVSVSFVTVFGLVVQMDGCPRTGYYVRIGLALIAVAFSCWLLDMFLCEVTQHLYLHAFGWHLFSAAAIAALHAGLASQICRQNKLSHISLFGLQLSTTVDNAKSS